MIHIAIPFNDVYLRLSNVTFTMSSLLNKEIIQTLYILYYRRQVNTHYNMY